MKSDVEGRIQPKKANLLDATFVHMQRRDIMLGKLTPAAPKTASPLTSLLRAELHFSAASCVARLDWTESHQGGWDAPAWQKIVKRE